MSIRKLNLYTSAKTLTALLGSVSLCINTAYAGPVGGNVVAGTADIAGQGSANVIVNQGSQRVVIDWANFDTNSNETVNFVQPNADALALNRIQNGSPTQFNGSLNANGNVIIMNGNGVVFGSTANVDVNGLVATTSNISNEDFMNQGQMVFDKPGNGDAAIVNNGQINVKEAGLVGFVAPKVVNNGVINAKLGKVKLASGDKFTFDLYGDGLVSIAASDAVNQQLVQNTGTINADGGLIQLTAAQARDAVDSVIINQGIIQARSIENYEGKIILAGEGTNAFNADGGNSAIVQSGTLDATGLNGNEIGGTVLVTADDVHLTSTSVIDASGNMGGGTIKVGGDYKGIGETPTAKTVSMDAGAVIKNNAVVKGNGGYTVVWSDDTTKFAGTIEGKGGAQGGKGGFVETSGKKNLKATGNVDLRAADGSAGDWLLDPGDILIYDRNAVGDGVNSFTTSYLEAQSASSNITISSSGDIYMNMNSDTMNLVADRNITLSATNIIPLSGGITTNGTGSIYLIASADIATPYGGRFTANGTGSINFTAVGDISLNAGTNITTNGGAINLTANSDTVNSGIISLVSANLTSNGGNINLRGWAAATDYSESHAIGINLKDTVVDGRGTTTGGQIIINGKGSAVDNSMGVNLDHATIKSNKNGYVSIAGTAQGTGATSNGIGIKINNGTTIITDDTSSITLNGTGGSGTGGNNYGILFSTPTSAGTDIVQTAGNASISITAQGGAGANSHGFVFDTANADTGIFINLGVTLTLSGKSNASSYGLVNFATTHGSPVNYGKIISSSSSGAIYLYADSMLNPIYTKASSINLLTFTDTTVMNIGTSGTGLNITQDILNNLQPTYLYLGNRYINNGAININNVNGFGIGTSVVFISTKNGDINFSGTTVMGGSAQLDAQTAGTGKINLTNAAITTASYMNLATGVNGYMTLAGNNTITNNGGNTTINTKIINPADPTFSSSLTLNSFFGVHFYDKIDGGINLTVTGGSINGSAAWGSTTALGNVSLTASNNVVISAINAKSILARGNATGVTINGQLTTTNTGDALVITGKTFINNFGATALNVTNGGRFLVWSSNPANDTQNGISYAFKQYNATYGVTTVAGSGNGFLYTIAPVISVSLTGTVTKTYDGTNAATLNSGNFSFGSAIDGDVVSISTPTVGTYNDKNAGTSKAVTANGFTVTGATNGGVTVYGYQVSSSATGNIGTINKANLTITANDATKVYGDTYLAAGTEFSQLGLISGDSITSVGLSSSGFVNTANASSTPYAINAASANGTGLSNYNITYVSGNITVTKANLTITANNLSKTYGQNLVFNGTEFTSSGLKVAGDTITGVSLVSSGSAASANASGTAYTITASNASGNGLSNYDITYVDGGLTVNKANLVLTANNQSKTYGQNFTFNGNEFTQSGLVNGDTVSNVNLSSAGSAVTANASVTPYTITASGATGTGLSNYNISYTNGGLTVNKANLIITANNQSKTYGQSFTFNGTEFTQSGLLNSDTISGIALSSTGSAATANASVIPYAITGSTASGTGLSNYNISYIDGGLTVNKANLTITANNQSKTYGQTFTFNGTEFIQSGLVNSDSITNVALSSTGAVATANASVTPYTITVGSASGTGLSNYNISYADGGLTVNKANLVITANNQSKTYGQTFTFNGTEFTQSGLVNGDTVSSIALSSAGSAATANASVTPYAITGSTASGTGLSNYNISYIDGGLTVNKANLTITANNQSKTYGQNFVFNGTEFSQSGLVNSDSIANVALSSTGAAATANASVTPYAITAGSASGNGLSNYNITYVDGGLTVNKANLVITANNQSKTYGQTFTFNGTEFTQTGLVNGDNVSSINLTSAGSAATANASVTPYTITASGATGTGLSNYNISYTNGGLTVNKANLTITANNQSKTYGQTFTFNGTEFTQSGLVNSDSITNVALSSTGTVATANASATPYAITAGSATGNGLSNYTINYVDGDLTVNKASLTITANNQSKTYGQNFTFDGTEFSQSGLLNSDTINTITLASAGAVNTANASAVPYAINGSNASGTGLANYTITYVDGGLTVNKANLTITANDQSKIYGQNFVFNGTEFSQSGLLNSDSITNVALSSTGAAGTANASATPYSIAVNSANGNGLSNYNITYTEGNLTVNKANLVITANNQSKTYGQNFTFNGTEFSQSGLLNSDTVTTVSLSSMGAAGTENASSTPYAISANSAMGSGLSNYNISYTDGGLTVNKAALVITANNQSKTYGQNFTFNGTEFTQSGLVNSDSITNIALSSTGAAATANASITPYAINGASAVGNGLSNYDITYVDGGLTVNKANLTVTANDQSKTYGQNFGFNGTEFSQTGLLNSDNITDVLLSSAGAAGTANASTTPYNIVISGANGTGLANYNITYIDGGLTVNKAALTITANNQTKTYGQNFILNGTEFTQSGLLNSDTIATVTLISGGAGATANASTTPYSITASNAVGNGMSNYDITYINGNFNVDKATLTITANNQTKTYGQNFIFSGTEFTQSGLVNSDNITGLNLSSSGSAATANASPSAYTISANNATGNGLSNYNIVYADGGLSVNKANLVIAANNQTKGYSQNFIFTGNEFTQSGLVNGDEITHVTFNSNGADMSANTGPYIITASNATGSGLSNYNISYADGILSMLGTPDINQKQLFTPMADTNVKVANATEEKPNLVNTLIPEDKTEVKAANYNCLYTIISYDGTGFNSRNSCSLIQ